MALKKTIAKLNDYYERLDQNKADRIKSSHVEKVLAKLEAKRKRLETAREVAKTSDKRHRIKRKLKVVDDQISRAQQLLEVIRAQK